MTKKYLWVVLMCVLILTLVPLLGACDDDDEDDDGSTTTPAGTTTTSPTNTGDEAKSLTGAGASFPYPLYSKWFDEYNKQFGVEVSYDAKGSGGGVRDITAMIVDFGASDGIMSDDEEAAAEAAGGPIMHIPMTAGAVAIIFHLDGIDPGDLKLTPDVLAGIYLGNITEWDDPAITAINPGVSLPGSDIAVVHRSDGSGTTYIFTNYLSKISSEWENEVGNAKSVEWPVGIGGEKNAGVAAQVDQLPNSIGYVELAYAIENDLPWASLQNKSGNYIEPSLEATSMAAEGVTLPDDMKIMITDSANPDAYPIAGFTWILVYKNQEDEATGRALAKLLWWGIHEGQSYSEALQYAPLPADAVTKAENEILSMNYNGMALITR